ncbi:MAG: DUF2007 domain-containing protein [Acidobacteria bacterium]|nr:DUF2007 domain-containing protein [Acidobacteriota bacterium]
MASLVTVGNYPDLASAEVAASLLEAAGIACMIPDENFAGLSWQMGSAIQGIRLQVALNELDAARQVLAIHEVPSPMAQEPQTSLHDERCVACGSESIGPPRWKNRTKAIAILFPLALLAWPILAAVKPRLQCSSCGHAWR